MLCSATKPASRFFHEYLTGYIPDDQLDAMFKQPYMVTASNILVRKSLRARGLYLKLLEHCKDIQFNNAPFAATLPDDPLSVVIYPNLKGNWHTDLDKAMWPVGEWSILPLWEQLCADLQNPAKAKRWEVPSRSIKIALKSEKTTLQRYLTNFSNLKTGLGWRDDQIRSLAEKMDTRLLLVECVDDMHFTEYYKTKTGGCVEYLSNHAGQDIHDEWRKLGDEGKYPGLFLKNCEELQLVFLKSKGVPVARAMLCKKNEQGKWTKFFYVRGQGEYREKMEAELKGNSYTRYASDYSEAFSFTKSFEVPSVVFQGKPSMPLPHMDEIKKNFAVGYDKSRNVFVVFPNAELKKGTPITSTYTYKGYVPFDRVKEI